MTQLVHASVSRAFLISAQEKFAKRTQFAIPFAQGAFPANESSQSADSCAQSKSAQSKFAKRTQFRPGAQGWKDLAHALVHPLATQVDALHHVAASPCVERTGPNPGNLDVARTTATSRFLMRL